MTKLGERLVEAAKEARAKIILSGTGWCSEFQIRPGNFYVSINSKLKEEMQFFGDGLAVDDTNPLKSRIYEEGAEPYLRGCNVKIEVQWMPQWNSWWIYSMEQIK